MLENPDQRFGDAPRASLILPRGTTVPEVSMGGAHTHTGEVVDSARARDAVLIDCAGDLPVELRAAARRFQACVFLDLEERPSSWLRIQEIVSGLHTEMAVEGGPERVVVLCTHGMNRSGLVAGMLLRQFGAGFEETVAMIRAARPGALSNETFVRLLAEM
jgi:protein-tyrosine phosphatase